MTSSCCMATIQSIATAWRHAMAPAWSRGLCRPRFGGSRDRIVESLLRRQRWSGAPPPPLPQSQVKREKEGEGGDGVLGEPSILHQEEHWFVIDKPAGWHSVSGTSKSQPAAAATPQSQSQSQSQLQSLSQSESEARLLEREAFTFPTPSPGQHHAPNMKNDNQKNIIISSSSINDDDDSNNRLKKHPEVQTLPAPSIQDWLSRHGHGRGLPESGLVHRLDLGTSGCLVCARNTTSYQDLRHLMSGRGRASARKMYLALSSARGRPTGKGEFKLMFGSRGRSSRKVTVVPDEVSKWKIKGLRGALEGICAWRCISEGMGSPEEEGVDAYEVEILGPGRRHQIRAGMCHIGAPLLGDEVYGGAWWPHQGFALHALSVTVQGVTVYSDPPSSMLRYMHPDAVSLIRGYRVGR